MLTSGSGERDAMSSEIEKANESSPDVKQKAAEIKDIINRADKKNAKPEDVAALRKLLAEAPTMWRAAGDIGRLAIDKLIETISGTPLIRESMAAGVTAIRRELEGENAPLIEKLLAEQAAICWLQMGLTQYAYAAMHEGESITLTRSEYWERRLSATQRRYLRAIETLARVRRLLRPHAVQVNIGAQQVNVIGETKPSAPHEGKKD